MNIDIKRSFLRLAGELSPENLHADGERSRAQAARVKARLMSEWSRLEAKVGRSVSTSEAYSWSAEVATDDARLRDEALANQPKHPLLVDARPHQWDRIGRSGRPAYSVYERREGGYVVAAGGLAFAIGRHGWNEPADTLDEAVRKGEAFMAAITRESVLAAHPAYEPATVTRILADVPAVLHLAPDAEDGPAAPTV